MSSKQWNILTSSNEETIQLMFRFQLHTGQQARAYNVSVHSYWQFYLSRFFSRNLAMFFHGFKRKPLWPLCVESGQRASTEYIQTQVSVNSHSDFLSGMAWTTEQGSVYRIELFSALQSVLVPPSIHHEWTNHALIVPISSLFTWLQWNPKHIHSTICNYLISSGLVCYFGTL